MPHFQYSYLNTAHHVNTNKGNCQPYVHNKKEKRN